MPKLKFNHCVVNVMEWERSNAFYRDVLGAEVSKRGSGWCYKVGDMQINCHGPGVATPTPSARVRIEPGASHLCFEWSGPIEEAAAHLQACGVGIELGPVRRQANRGTGTSLYFYDPDGTLLEFISYSERTA